MTNHKCRELNKKKGILETRRLCLRELTEADFSSVCRILQDDLAMTAYEGAFTDEEVRDWLDRQFDRYSRWGIGLWAVTLRETGELIGQCGLTWQPWRRSTVLEVGYLFDRSYWHQGYASEAAEACIRYAFDHLEAETVSAIIRETNSASRKTAERLGMKPVDRETRHYKGVDMPHIRYEILRSDQRKN